MLNKLITRWFLIQNYVFPMFSKYTKLHQRQRVGNNNIRYLHRDWFFFAQQLRDFCNDKGPSPKDLRGRAYFESFLPLQNLDKLLWYIIKHLRVRMNSTTNMWPHIQNLTRIVPKLISHKPSLVDFYRSLH
jgi:hypothetical protein